MYTFLRFPEFRKKALTLSYDDGVIYDKKLIEIMSEHKLKGTFNLSSGLFGYDSRRMSEEEALSLYLPSGNEVAVHGRYHLPLAELDSSAIVSDVFEDRKELERIFGGFVRGMAYAYGSFDDKTVEALKMCGIAYSRTTYSTERFDIPADWLRLPPTCHHNNPRLMQLADEFLMDVPPRSWVYDKPKLFYLWGHSYEFNDNDNWDVIEKFAEKTGNRDDVWYATNMRIYEYVRAFDSLIFDADGTRVKNPSSVDLWICLYGQNIYLRAGEEAQVGKKF